MTSNDNWRHNCQWFHCLSLSPFSVQMYKQLCCQPNAITVFNCAWVFLFFFFFHFLEIGQKPKMHWKKAKQKSVRVCVWEIIVPWLWNFTFLFSYSSGLSVCIYVCVGSAPPSFFSSYHGFIFVILRKKWQRTEKQYNNNSKSRLYLKQ